MRRQKWLATFGSRARAMRPGLFLPEATPVKHSPAGTLTLVPAYPPRNRPASTWRKPSRQRNVDETWPATARGNRIPTTLPSAFNRRIPPACPLLYQHRDRAALAISGSPAPLILSSYLILP